MKTAAIVAALLLAITDRAEAQGAPPKPVPLEKIELKKDRLRAGWDFPGASIPPSGWQAKVGTQPLVFLDLNGDGALEPDVDGFSMASSPFVVPIPSVLLLPTGQFDVAFDGVRGVTLTRQRMGTAEAFLADAAAVTELRMRAGVRLAVLDADMSAASEKHCDYLKANRMNDGRAGMAAHQEEPAKAGYTPEGAEAGKYSCLGFNEKSLRLAIFGWYATAWHGPPIVDPSLRRFGAAFKHGVSMYYGSLGPPPPRNFVHPADGATDVQRTFGERGEMPNPVPGTTHGIGSGFPIFVRLASPRLELTTAIVKDPKGNVVKGTFSSPAKPATPDWPTNSGCAVFIPSAPLLPKTRYTVRFEFGTAPAIEWAFTTAAN